MSTHWPEVPLEDVLTERQETPEEQDILTGKIRIISKIGFNDGKIQLREETKTRTKMILAYPGDLVVSGINAAKGAIAVYGEDNKEPIAATIHYGAYVPNKDKVELKYLWWLLRSNTFKDLLNRYVPGGIKTELKAKRLLPVPIPLPPLPEQRRIVDKIEGIIERIKEVDKFREDSQIKTESLLKSYFHSLFKTRKGWHEKHVKDICEPPQYGYTASAIYEKLGPKFLRITDIQNGQVNWERVPYCDCPNSKPYLLKNDDILFAQTGATTGKSFLIKDCPTAVFASYLIRLRLKEDVLPEYLYFYFQSPLYWQQVHEEKKGTGQPNLNGTKLSNIIVPIPSSKQEQEEIVSQCNYISKKISAIKNIQSRSDLENNALLPSILDRAFKGEL